MRRLLIAMAVILAACESEPPQPVVVYVPTEFEERANSWLPESGLAVTVITGDSSAITDKVIAKQDSPRADVLITSGVPDIWRAADRGALRPIQSELFDTLHDALKDPDRSWAAIDIRSHVILHANDARPLTIRLDDLGTPEFSGRICLSSPDLSINRSLIAYLIEERGVKEAERLVRRWVKNLAASPFATESELVGAIQAGRCDYGITSWPIEFEGVTPLQPETLYLDVSAAGVARHAGNPEAAQELLDWLLRNRQIVIAGDSEPVFAGIAGFRDEEARLLAERAGYR